MGKAFDRACNFEICGVSPLVVALVVGELAMVAVPTCAVLAWIAPRSLVLTVPAAITALGWWMWEHR